MKELEERHLKEIWNIEADTGNYGEYGGINKQSMEEVAKECANITKEIAIGFADWIANNWYFNGRPGCWGSHEKDSRKEPKYLIDSTEELFTEYLKTLK